MEKVVEHLKNALLGESLVRFTQSRNGDWNHFGNEISDEIGHVVRVTHETSVRAILGQLLLESAQSQWTKIINEIFPLLDTGPLVSTDIPIFLRLARKKLVLLILLAIGFMLSLTGKIFDNSVDVPEIEG
jgi:hypothetical protein